METFFVVVGLRDEGKMGVFGGRSDVLYTFGHPAMAELECVNSARSSGAWRSLCAIHESSE